MNIYAARGHKVKVTEKTKNAGYEPDAKRVAEHLEIEKIYTVDYTDVGSWSTDVYLIEITATSPTGRRISFNSVNFVDVEEAADGSEKAHPDWKRYNENKWYRHD